MTDDNDLASSTASAARLENSRVFASRYRFDLKDIEGLFEAYDDHDDDDDGGTLVAVLGLDEDGRPDMHLILKDESGKVLYAGNVSHPCPPEPCD